MSPVHIGPHVTVIRSRGRTGTTYTGRLSSPFVSEEQFAVRFKFDVTFKPTGNRMEMTEMALYTVKDGKIAQEEFFYNMPGT